MLGTGGYLILKIRISRKLKWTSLFVVLCGLAAAGCTLGFYVLHRDSDGSFTRHTKANYQPDVVVIGSELEGMYLAQKAKLEGLNVLILETKDGLGGQLLQGEMLYLDGTYDDRGTPLMQGGMN